MWVALLDQSGSMGRTFEGETDFDGVKDLAQDEVKFDAARRALREHLSSLGQPDDIAIIAFTSTSHVVFRGSSDERLAIEEVLAGLKPHDGTNVACALEDAGSVLDEATPGLHRVLVVTDGLDDASAAEDAARALTKGRYVIVDVVLIDPTPRGEELCSRIAVRGSVRAVTSAAELVGEIGETATERRRLAAQADAAVQRAAAEQAEVEAERGSGTVAFTGAWPTHLERDRWHALLVFVHLAELESDVHQRIREWAAMRRQPLAAVAGSGRARLPLGTLLRIEPRAPNVVFNPPSTEIAYLEEIQEVEFRLRLEDGAAPRSLVPIDVQIFVGDSVVGLIRGTSEVGAPSRADHLSPTTTTMVDRVFASYSRKDADVVDACARAYRALGIYVFIDREGLRGGEIWEHMLEHHIEEADLFQLFWSARAEASRWVEREWRHALERAPGKAPKFIRPVAWEDEAPPLPSELAHIQLARLSRAAAGSEVESPTAAVRRGAVHTAGVFVQPLLPELTRDAERDARSCVAAALGSLERRTGLVVRGVPTLLVDHQVVRDVREMQTVDAAPPPPDLERVRQIGEELKALCLMVHVGQLLPEHSGWKERSTLLGRLGGLTEAQADAFLDFAEWLVAATVGVICESNDQLDEQPSSNVASSKVEGDWARLAATGLAGFGKERRLDERVASFVRLIASMLGEVERELGALPEPTDGRWAAQLRERPSVAYVEALTRDWEAAFGGGDPAAVTSRLAIEVPTYGIYLPAASRESERALQLWAGRRGVPVRFTLPGQPRVLLCVEAIGQWARTLRGDPRATGRERSLALALLRSVLVHEHFHAVVDTVRGPDGHLPATACRPGYEGLALEEALAAWLQLAEVSHDDLLRDLTLTWVDAGRWPGWPYRGAREIDRLAAETGAGFVRDLVERLRTDPKRAQDEFEKQLERRASSTTATGDGKA